MKYSKSATMMRFGFPKDINFLKNSNKKTNALLKFNSLFTSLSQTLNLNHSQKKIKLNKICKDKMF
jgi:hypothetical protein